MEKGYIEKHGKTLNLVFLKARVTVYLFLPSHAGVGKLHVLLAWQVRFCEPTKVIPE